ncbi:MAG: radical SAM protein [Halobacteriota archaeon]
MGTTYVEREFNKNLGLVMTLRCPITCPHCFLDAGPSRKEEVNLQDAHNWIRQAALYRNGFIRGLSLTGGEPFFVMEKLADLVNFATSLGFETTVTTNAFWAVTREKALEVLESLPLKMLGISTDTHHQRFLPFSYIENAVYAAEECGIAYNIIVAAEDMDSPECRKVVEDVTKITDYENIEITTLFPIGRAKQLQIKKSYLSTPPEIPCLFATTPFIFPDGKVTACIGPLATLAHNHPLILGSLRENTLEEILEASEENLVLQALRLWGPGKLCSILAKRGRKDLVPERFKENDICDACYSLFENEEVVKEMVNLDGLREEIAFARAFYTGEVGMVEKLLGKKIMIKFVTKAK